MRNRLSSVWPVRGTWVVLILLGLTTISSAVRAETGKIIFETIGVSLAVGTVLGASTLPFYDQPGTHLMNTAYGASAGLIAGVGILLTGWLDSVNVDEQLDARASVERNNSAYRSGSISGSPFLTSKTFLVQPVSFWTPVVSLHW